MAPEPPRAGLCADCREAEVVSSQRSSFLRCRLSDRDPRFPRYPPLPVLACSGFAPAAPPEPPEPEPRPPR